MRDTFFVMDHLHTMYIWDNSQTLVTIEDVENIAQSVFKYFLHKNLDFTPKLPAHRICSIRSNGLGLKARQNFELHAKKNWFAGVSAQIFLHKP